MSLLLKKEWRLAMHPAALCFLLLSALLLIPNYPYYVTFFYTSLGVYFVCLSGRENGDIPYSLLLPVGKKTVVQGRFALVILLEMTQMILAVPFAVLRGQMPVPPNAAGIEANAAFFGFSFLMLGLFNLVFFLMYYKNVEKVGRAFVVSSTVMFLYMGIVEALVHLLPGMDVLDTPDPQFLTVKLAVLLTGGGLFVLFTFIAYHCSLVNFEKQDV